MSNLSNKADGLFLKEIAEQLNSPVSEEHAWAIAYLTTRALTECDCQSSLDTLAQIRLDNILVSKSGNVKLMKESRKNNTAQNDFKKALQNIGMVVYQLLDYGLPEDQERTLSCPLEALIETLIEIDIRSNSSDEDDVSMGSPSSSGTQDSGITVKNGAGKEMLAKVIQACEHHVMEMTDPLDHYRDISIDLVRKGLQILDLQRSTQTEQSESPHQNNVDKVWKCVMESVRQGVELQPVPKNSFENDSLKLNKFDYFLMSVARFDKNRLKKIEFDNHGNAVSDHAHQLPSLKPSLDLRGGRRATVGDVHGAIMSELLTRSPLKPVSDRKLRSKSVDPSLTPMQSLMAEIQSPPALRRVKLKSPKRFSMSLGSYQMCKSNPDLLNTPLTPPPRMVHPNNLWANAQGRHLSLSTASLSSPHYSHSPHPAHTLTHTSSAPRFHNNNPNPKKLKSFFRKLTHKIAPKDKNVDTVRRSSCPNLLDEPDTASPMSPVLPYHSSISCSTLRGARSSLSTLPPLCSLEEDDVFSVDSFGPPPVYPQYRPRPHSVSMQSAVPLSRGYRRNSSWDCRDIHGYSQRRSSVDVINTRRRTLLDVPKEYSRYYSPRTPTPQPSPLLSRYSPHPHTLTHSGHISPEPPTTLSDVSLQLPLHNYEPTTLSELIHVRTNVTKSELHNVQLSDKKMFKNLQQEKVCFSCHKTKFSLFNHPHLCKICNRKVCSKCGKKYPLKSPPTPLQVMTFFWDPFSPTKAVYMCTLCFMCICPEEMEHYDC